MEAIDELIMEIRRWFYSCSEPIPNKRAFNLCPICGGTWWKDKERPRHNIGCWIPDLFDDLRLLSEKEKHEPTT
jgi:hypothetical protein